MEQPITLDALHKAVVFELEKQGIAISPEVVEQHARALLGETVSDTVLIKQLLDRIFNLGVLSDLLKDPEVTEVMVNGHENIYIEKRGVLSKTDLKFSSEEELLLVINRIVSEVGRRVDASQPLCDARLSDGSRVNVIISPLSLSGPVLTIRRFPQNTLSLQDLVEKNSASQNMAEFLRACIKAKLNIIISGGTGGGKTTLLNALASEIDADERLVTIEDSAEMRIQLPHLISLEARQANIEGAGEIPIRTLVKNALRMRPDRIIVGEIRSGEALDMLQAMNTGHQGSLTTVHANAPLEALFRLETMCLMSNVELPLSAIRQQISQAIHVVLQQERLSDGSRKITSVSMVVGIKDDAYEVVELFLFNKAKGIFEATGLKPSHDELFDKAKVSLNKTWFK